MTDKLLDALKNAEILGLKNTKIYSTCDNICDDFCNDCPADVAMKLKPYKSQEIKYNN